MRIIISFNNDSKQIIIFRNINRKDGTAVGGIWLNEKYQKNGYGTEEFLDNGDNFKDKKYLAEYMTLKINNLDLFIIDEKINIKRYDL